jgi:hypothetical protein
MLGFLARSLCPVALPWVFAFGLLLRVTRSCVLIGFLVDLRRSGCGFGIAAAARVCTALTAFLPRSEASWTRACEPFSSALQRPSLGFNNLSFLGRVVCVNLRSRQCDE